MLRTLDRHAKILGYCVGAAWTTSCTIYDSALLAEARGGESTTESAPDGSGGTRVGNSGGTGGRSTGVGPSTGGDQGNNSMGGSGNENSLGGADGDPSCPMEDCCPTDPAKDLPGQCGCGIADTDRDGDQTADCHDLCPDEPTKSDPGDCGCGVPASDEETCSALKNGIIHRYSFEGTGAEAIDSVGRQHGAIQNGGLQSGGSVAFNGIDQYVTLPAGMISPLTNATLEVWFTWHGGADYQRIIDFGDTQGDPAGGLTYLYLAASKKDEGPGSGFSLTGKTQFATESAAVLEIGVQYHLVLVIDGEGKAFSFYVNSAFQSGVAFDNSLSNINDIYGYLGRSLFAGDPYLSGSIDELRIYDVALSKAQVAYSGAQGKDTSIFE